MTPQEKIEIDVVYTWVTKSFLKQFSGKWK
jgi:hypothetical protein